MYKLIMTTSNRFARLVLWVTSQWVLFIFQLPPGVIISVVVCNNTNISPSPPIWPPSWPQNVSSNIFSSATWEQFAKKPKSDPTMNNTDKSRNRLAGNLVSKWALFTINGEHYWFNFRISPTFPDVSWWNVKLLWAEEKSWAGWCICPVIKEART